MKKILVICAGLLLCSNIAFAQQIIKDYKLANTYGFNSPYIVDSISNNGKSFSAANYLHSAINSKDFASYKNVQTNEEFLTLPKSNKDYTLSTYYFEISTTSFNKLKMEILSNAMFKLSLADKKVKEKLTSESSIDSATITTFEQDMEPGTYIFGLTLLSENKNVDYKLKIILPNEKAELSASGLTLKTMLCGENPYSVSISNNGKYYLAKYSTTDANGKRTYRAEVRDSKNNNIIYKTDEYSVEWMPSSTLLYTKSSDKVTSINPLNSQKTTIAENVPEGDITWLKNEEQFILSQTTKQDNTLGDLHRMYLPDDRIPGWRDRTNLSLYNIEDNSLQPLTYGYHSTFLNDINSEENKILFSISKDSITIAPFTFSSLYEMDLNTLQIDTLIYMDEGFICAQYIPASDELAVLGNGNFQNGIGLNIKKNQKANAFNNSVFLLNRKTKAVQPISKFFNPSINSIKVRNNYLYLLSTNRDSISVFKYNIKDKSFSLMPLNLDIVHDFDIDSNENQIVFYGENYDKPNRVFSGSLQNNNITEVYFPKKDAFSRLDVGKMDTWSFKSKDGSTIDGRIYYPNDFSANKKYPMIVYYYGGVSPTDRSFEMRYSAYLYTQQGYLVYVINPSGTIGWGQEFAARHVNAWGDYTADEIIEGVKRICKEKTFIDSKHIGCIGASYGGFMTQYLQTKTDIFAAAISHAGISNITSYWGEGYWGYSYGSAAQRDSYPWNNPELYTKHSPLFNANKIKTPLLLLHGTSDTNVPIGESIQMYNALKILGKEVEFITIKGENHGIVDFQKRLAWQNTIYAWFAKWLKGDNTWWDTLYPKENY